MRIQKRIMSYLLITILMLGTLSHVSFIYAAPKTAESSIVLADQNKAAPICIDTTSKDYGGISLIADAVADDIEMITGRKPQVHRLGNVNSLPSDSVVIIAGTLEDPLIKDQNLTWDISSSNDKFKSNNWERYQIKVVESSSQTKIVIAGSDKRGAIYGLFHISQDLGGVSPWVWWSDVTPEHKDTLSFTKQQLETISKTPSVKYRGIFLNNEAPSLSTYVSNKFGNYNYLFYDNVFELLLRLKANYLWPAMWGNSFSDDGVLNIGSAKDKSNQDKLPTNERDKLANARLADKYGVVIGLSHHEPMARAGVEWQRLQNRTTPTYNKATKNGSDGKPVAKNLWNYFLNGDNIYDFWKDGIERNRIFSNNLITIGMRGEGDSKLVDENGKVFGLQENVDLLKKVIMDQKEILTNHGMSDDPQMLALYTEVQQYWYGFDEEKPSLGKVPGLNEWEVLKDDIVVLCDDNHGYTRFLPEDHERNRNWGMYYHFDMNGGAHSYKWINTVPLQRTWDNMTMSYDYGIDDLWIVNVGDLKPLELPISYFIDLGYDFDTWGTKNPNSTKEYTKKWTQQQFGSEFSENEIKDVAKIITDYVDMNGRRKPEILYSDTFSLTNYNEAQKELAKAIALENAAQEYWEKFQGTKYEDAFYQLVYYPAVGTACVNKMMIFQGLNQMYAKHGSTVANTYAKLVKETVQKDKDILTYYNKSMASGKWNGMMNQTGHVAYKGWEDSSGAYPEPTYIIPAPGNALQVEVPNVESPINSGEAALPDFENTEKQQYAITLSNGGDTSVDYEIARSADWIQLTGSASGNLYTAKTLGVYVDWSKVTQDQSGFVTITSAGSGQTITLNVNAKVLDTSGLSNQTFLSSNGVISINAKNYTKVQAADGTEWKHIEEYGKWGSTMKMFPTTKFFDANKPENAPFLEYTVVIPKDGTYKLTGCFGQSNNAYPEGALRYGVQTDNGGITVKNSLPPGFSTASNVNAEWSRDTKNAGRTATTEHTLSKGTHTIRIYGIDAGLQLQRLVLSESSLKTSYLGPDETYYKGKDVEQQPLVFYQVPQQIMSVPGTINAVDCTNEDAVRNDNVLNASAGKVYTYPVIVAADDTYLFNVTGKSTGNAKVTVKVGDTVAAEVNLTSELRSVMASSGVDLKTGEYQLEMEVTGSAEISAIQSEQLDTEPGLDLNVSASSGNAGKAFDRKNSTAWIPDPEDEKPALTMDFEDDIIYADHFTLIGSFRDVSGYKVQTSTDGSTWIDVYTSENPPENGRKIYIQDTNAWKGTKWRFVFNEYSEWLKVSEIKLNTFINWAIQDENPQFIDTVEGSTNSQSSTRALIDGNRVGRPKVANIWVVQSGSETATLQFSEERTLTGIYVLGIQNDVENNGTDPNAGITPDDIITGTRISATYDASYQSTDGTWSNWETYQTGSKILFYIDFGKAVQAKAVRLRVPTSSTGGYVRIMEMEPVELRRYTAIPEQEFTVTYRAGTGGTVMGETTQSILYGKSTTEVKAAANDGYQFVKWDDGNTSTSRKDIVTEDKTFTAEFIKETVDNDPAVQAVIDMIQAIGKVTAHSKDSIEAAEKAYANLTEDQKKLVTNYNILVAARKAYSTLIANEAPAKGMKYVVGNLQYKVTKSSKTNGTVEFIKSRRKTLNKVIIPPSIKINGYTFKVTTIAKKAFQKNAKLKSVTIGKNITSIGANAWKGCKNLRSITIQSANLKKVGQNAFKGTHKRLIIKVPAKQLKRYKKLFMGKGLAKKAIIRK